MKQELLDLIHLNTYIDYSTNKASGNDIDELVSKCEIAPPDDYLNFLRKLNGFQLYKLIIYGTNNVREFDSPSLKQYFVMGEGFEELYSYSHADKKYYTLWYIEAI